MNFEEDDVANVKEKGNSTSVDAQSVSATVDDIGVSVAEASDQLEETLQSGLQAMLVKFSLADEASDSNPILALLRNHPVLSVGAATLVGGAVGFVVRRFNPIRGKK